MSLVYFFFFFGRSFWEILKFWKKVLMFPRKKPQHSFHLVTNSPWPLYTSLAILFFVVGLVLYMHSFQFGKFVLFFGFFYLIGTLSLWWRDVIREAVFERYA
jgi:hypothetical protein